VYLEGLVTSLLVHPNAAGDIVVTPESARWRYVGFEVLDLHPGRPVDQESDDREVCIVVVQGTASVESHYGEWHHLGGRADPWSGPPDAVYLPPGTSFRVEGDGEVALCFAPAPDGGDYGRLLPRDEIEVEVRGRGNTECTIHPILMADREAESLLVYEVLTPAGHWSSYPPHKHDRNALPEESYLEETYYHRIRPLHGFALQRVYTADRSLDETIAVRDRDTVLVPRGYHTVSAPPGYDLYCLNVMAGPARVWAIQNDPDHEWTLQP
jgi:5-deoxy-glucuronate isomerase